MCNAKTDLSCSSFPSVIEMTLLCWVRFSLTPGCFVGLHFLEDRARNSINRVKFHASQSCGQGLLRRQSLNWEFTSPLVWGSPSLLTFPTRCIGYLFIQAFSERVGLVRRIFEISFCFPFFGRHPFISLLASRLNYLSPKGTWQTYKAAEKKIHGEITLFLHEPLYQFFSN